MCFFDFFLLEVTKMEEGQTKRFRLGAGFRPPFSGIYNMYMAICQKQLTEVLY